MYYALIGEDAPGTLQTRLAVRPEHVARLETLRDEGRLLLAGPMPAIDSPDPGPAGFTGSLIVAEFPSGLRIVREADACVARGDIEAMLRREEIFSSHLAMWRKSLARHAYLEVFVDAPVEICEGRDPKGLYAKARRGEIKEFTGISSPYERPEDPDVHIRTDQVPLAESVDRVLAAIDEVVRSDRPGGSDWEV